MIEYSFVILGAPVGQGNLQPVPLRKGTTDDGKAIWDWERPKLIARNEKELKLFRREVERVAREARQKHGFELVDRDVAVKLTVVFYFQRPQDCGTFTRHTKRLDVDKCVRALSDALTEVAWVDDSQVDEVHAYKRYAAGGQDPLGPRGVPRTVVQITAQDECAPKEVSLFGDAPAAVTVVPAARASRKRERECMTQDF